MTTTGAALDFTPAPGRAPYGRMLAAQTGIELRLTLRRGESLLLVAIILTGLTVDHALVLIPSIFLVGFFFANLGVLIGVRAEQFDDVAFAQTFILTPLIFLGGVFYSASLLPAGARPRLDDDGPSAIVAPLARSTWHRDTTSPGRHRDADQ